MGTPFTPTSGPRFSQADHALDAALAGVGIAMGRRALVVKDIHEGRLVAHFPTALATGARFSFLCLKGLENRPQIATFRDWMLSEIEKMTHITDSLTILDLTAG
jgi:LysR family transcriptional regulator, glycine cleavage system transcriptional activator